LKLPSRFLTRLVIGDFGCGEAKIMETLSENKVHSFDYVAINDKVTACDMRSVPLKEDEKLDIAVFSLSLMGVNWPDYIAEAKRCLEKNGYLFIAETKVPECKTNKSSRRDKRASFEIYSDEEKGDFTFIEARKI
jgi:hypothetical protein